MSTGLAVSISAVLLVLNAFFVGAEFALISARRSAIEDRPGRAAKITLGAMEHVSLMMAGAQLGITVCSLGLGYLGTIVGVSVGVGRSRAAIRVASGGEQRCEQ